MMPFVDRRDAGKQLGEALSLYRGSSLRVVVYGLPRGGVPVAYEVAQKLNCGWDLLVVRKLGVPGYPELAMGAIASGGIVVRNEDVIDQLGIDDEAFDRVRVQQLELLKTTEKRYGGDGERETVPARGAICIIVDDGIATGASMRAAVVAMRSQDPVKIIVAAPVAAPSVQEHFGEIADRIVCVHMPPDFSSVGAWYMNFDQTTDEEVAALLYNKHLP